MKRQRIDLGGDDAPPGTEPASLPSPAGASGGGGGVLAASAVNALTGRAYSKRYFDLRDSRQKLPAWGLLGEFERLGASHQAHSSS